MVKKIALALASFCCLVAIGGCGNSDAAQTNDNSIVVDVVNHTDNVLVSYALFYGPDIEEWGEDFLGDEVIEPGEEYSFVLPEGTYTVILMTYEYYIVGAARDFSEDTSIEIGDEEKVSILVRNNTDVEIALLFMSPADSTDWGDDILGDEVIPAGMSRFIFVKPDVYDIMAIGLNRETILEAYGLIIDDDRTFTIE